MPQCVAHYITIKNKNQLKSLRICDIIPPMAMSAEKILEFHRARTATHIECLNYHAGLLGYHFPEHDNDKTSGTIQNGYAYINYAKYHPECRLTPAQLDLYEHAHAEHHKTQPHHIEYYDDVSKISDMTLVQMVCDWFSANFEQIHVLHEISPQTVMDYFDMFLRNKPGLNWSAHQIDLIAQLCDFLDAYADFDTIMDIWRPLLDM